MTAVDHTGGPFGAFPYRPRRTYRSGPPSARDVAASAPWCCRPDEHLPLTISIEPGHTVRIDGRALAELAGLSEVAPVKGYPLTGELAGAVVLSNVQAMAYVSGSAFPYTKLKAHQLTSITLHAGSWLEVAAHSQRGTIQVWTCTAVEASARAPAGGAMEYPEGPAGCVLRAATNAMDSADELQC